MRPCWLYRSDMHVIAVGNQKGGVGKTATTINVGAADAEAGKRTLLVDLDPQGHLTRALGLPDAGAEANLPRALLGQYSGDLGGLVIPVTENLHVIPASQEMFVLEPQLYAKTGREFLLSRLLDGFAPAFDICLIDCPPSLGALTDSALVAARTDPESTPPAARHTGGLVIPVQAEDSSLDALRLLIRQVSTLSDALQIQVDVLGLVVNMYDSRRGRIATSMLETFHRRSDVLAVVHDRKEIREGWRLHQPVITHAPESEAAGWYRALAKKVMA